MQSRQWKLAAVSVALALCSIGFCAQAGSQSGPPEGQTEQGPGPGPGRGNWRGGPERELEMLTKRLTLTADQQTGVKAILGQQSTQMKALREKSQGESATADTTEARQARMTQMQQIRDESNTKINALLDDNQKKTFAEMIARQKAAMERRRQGGDGPPPPDGAGGPPPPPNADR